MILCIPKIADYGGFKIGVPIIDPNTPPLLIVNVPPAISSIVIFPYFPLFAKSIRFFIKIFTFSISANPFFSTFLITGTIRPDGVATATEMST